MTPAGRRGGRAVRESGDSSRAGQIDPGPAAPLPPGPPEIIRDPLWDNIRVDRPALLALDTPAVQRLRYIRQVGHTFLVYPGATHSRFEHALGAFHLTRRALAALEELGDLGPVSAEECLAVRMAALLHDIGHYPFSHALEEAGFPSH
ncbi:MAG: HD domain-containing protein, partial [Gemmatimonadales bacterium]